MENFLKIIFFIYFFSININASENCTIYTDYFTENNEYKEVCCEIDKGLEFLVKNPKFAEKIFLDNIKKTNLYYCKVVSHAYLAYIYSDYDLKKSNLEIRKAVDLIIKNNNESDSKFLNFKSIYLDESSLEQFPLQFNSKNDIINGITFIIPYFTSDMLLENINILDSIKCHFGDARDSWGVPFFIFLKPHLDIVFDLNNVNILLESENFKNIKKNRKFSFDIDGTIKFCIFRDFRVSEIAMSLLPIEAFKNDNDYCIYVNDDFELNEKICYSDLEKYFDEDLELKKLYDIAIKDIEDYYFKVLNLNGPISSKYAEYAIKKIILDNIYYR